jgi:FkbM family methyltransferase
MVSRRLQGVFRSLRLYHGPSVPKVEMDALYRSFIEPGDLVFDVGAHVGDRVSSFRRLGARVIAVEPQPLLVSALGHIHGGDPLVEIVARACGREADTLALHINTANPTVSTLSETFLRSAQGASGWEGQNWDDEIAVDVVTLDALVGRYGTPQFIKIDTEGAEDAVLNGLSYAVASLSFEFTTIARGVAITCLKRLSRLGDYRYNLALGESQKLSFDPWLSPAEMETYLSSVPHAANSGDVYAVLWTPRQ